MLFKLNLFTSFKNTFDVHSYKSELGRNGPFKAKIKFNLDITILAQSNENTHPYSEVELTKVKSRIKEIAEASE